MILALAATAHSDSQQHHANNPQRIAYSIIYTYRSDPAAMLAQALQALPPFRDR
jgi:hypothetical protein